MSSVLLLYFVFCVTWLSEDWGQGKGIFEQGTGNAAVHKVVHMLLYCKNFIGMNIKIIYADSSEFPKKCPCACLHLPVLILSVDSDWLISIKVSQSLTGNRNYFYLRQSWLNFDQVSQSGGYTIKVCKSKSVKVTWSNFDQINFDSVNRLWYKQQNGAKLQQGRQIM